MSLKVAITGGIGCGKSTVCNILREMGYPVYSCDEIYSEVIKSSDYISQIRTAFPDAVSDNQVNREVLAGLVFQDRRKLKCLNAIAHPLIMKRLLNQMQRSQSLFVFAEVPLLFEGNFENLFDKIIVVDRDREQRIHAVCDRDRFTTEKVIKRIHSQFNYDSEESKVFFKKIGAHVFSNNGDILNLRNQIENFINIYKK